MHTGRYSATRENCARSCLAGITRRRRASVALARLVGVARAGLAGGRSWAGHARLAWAGFGSRWAGHPRLARSFSTQWLRRGPGRLGLVGLHTARFSDAKWLWREPWRLGVASFIACIKPYAATTTRCSSTSHTQSDRCLPA